MPHTNEGMDPEFPRDRSLASYSIGNESAYFVIASTHIGIVVVVLFSFFLIILICDRSPSSEDERAK